MSVLDGSREVKVGSRKSRSVGGDPRSVGGKTNSCSWWEEGIRGVLTTLVDTDDYLVRALGTILTS